MTMTEDATWTQYTALWRRGEDAGVDVHFIGFTVQGEDGFFDPHVESNAKRGPELAIVRPYYSYASDDPLGYKPTKTRRDGHPVDLLRELCTLAHELGHVRSWQRKERTGQYADALGVFNNREKTGLRPTPEQCGLIKAEEMRAWQYGEDELRSLGFLEWTRFREVKDEALKKYDELLDRI
jgi:hypothetical protein